MKRPSRSAVVALATLATLATAAWPAAATAAASPRFSHAGISPSAIESDAQWLLQGQLPDGAIAWYIDKAHISPYQANYAAIGLAEAAKQTGSTTYADAAWSWLAWYAAHEDSTSFVTDYNIDSSGVETSTDDEDSTDAYAGTYLSAVRAAFLADPAIAKLRNLHAGVSGAVRAIEATQDTDGLTWAKPTWHVKYLMDQTETYSGLVSAAEIADLLGDSALHDRAVADAQAMQAGIASLWDAPTDAYDWAESDGVTTTDWTVLYPDAMAQAWVAGSAASSSSRARHLMKSLDQFQPQWDSPNAPTNIDGSAGTVGYWPVAGWALLRLGKTSQAATAADSIRSAALANDRAWPYTTGVAGELIVLESGDPSLAIP